MKWLGLTVAFAIIIFCLYEVLPRSSATSQPTGGMSASAMNSVPAKATQFTILLDVSASRPKHMITEGKSYVESLVDGMNFGDQLLIWQMYEEGVNDPESHFRVTLKKSDEITSLEEQEALNAARRQLRNKVDLFFEAAQQKRVIQTDILSTLSIASEQISAERRNLLVLLSDMFQSDKRFEFEHLKRMPPPDWIEAEKQAGLIRPLDQACVIVVGADPSTKEGAAVRNFWQKYFEASDARLAARNYRTTPPNNGTCVNN